MYSNWPYQRCSEDIHSRRYPSDGSNDDDDVTTPKKKEGAEDHLNKKNSGNTASVGRRPCAIYDYESAVQPSAVMDKSSSLLPQRSNVAGLKHDDHHATLDRLCHPSYHRVAVRIDS